MTPNTHTEAMRLADEIKRLAEDMADAACATEAGEFVAKERKPLHEAIDRLRDLASSTMAEGEALRKERDQHLRARCEFGDIIANHCIAMQAALVEWYGSGTADKGMQWIENTLSGPGLLPDMKEAAALGGAQAWFDAKMAEHEAFRAANPPPERTARASLDDGGTKSPC